jgi:hypothetical protein
MQDHLPISAIKCYPFLQQRSPQLIDDKYDSKRQEANLSSTIVTVRSDLNNGQKIRVPLDVHEVDEEYLLVDGHHRYQGALAHCKDAKIDHASLLVPVNIIKGSTLNAAIDASLDANLNHGVGLSGSELKHSYFKRYVWSRSVPTLSKIMSDTGCAKATASNIAYAAKWCVGVIESNKDNIDTPPMLESFMIKQMDELGITSARLDDYGLPSYSLLRKVLKGDLDTDSDTYDSHNEHVKAVAETLEYLEGKYGVHALREGLRKHKTGAHDIIVSQHSKWISKPATASLLAGPLDLSDEF